MSPSPLDMPMRRRPEIPQKPPSPAAPFRRARDIPRCGSLDADYWPDAGILLNLGVDDDFRRRFVARFASRAVVPKKIEDEVRGLTHHKRQDLANAAATVTHSCFIKSRVFARDELVDKDQEVFDEVLLKLKAVPGAKQDRHAGEAIIITIAARRQLAGQRPQVIFCNDGGASVVADSYRIAARHVGEIIAELACHFDECVGEAALALFQACCSVSAPPKSARQTKPQDFVCGRSNGQCPTC